MIQVYLSRIKTRDGIWLDGIVIEPKRKSKTALIWIHGLGSNFAHGQPLIAAVSNACTRRGIAYFKFNTRGHDIVHRDMPVNQGSGLEKFEACAPDIRAIIGFGRKLGYRKIILAGHSTGANKVLYYQCKTKDPSVKGLLLLGPVSDIAAGRKKFGVAGLARGVAIAEKIAKKNPQALMPIRYGIVTARRFLSMFRQGGAEDVFPYLDLRANWKELKSVRVPLAAIFGSRDQYLDRPAKEIIEIFRANARSTKSFTSVIIQGADHSFRGKEKELSRAIINWIKSNGL